jgi:hypothetical protein
MHKPPSDYRLYSLCLWRNGDTAPWRVWLQEAGSDERQAFADLPALLAFLEIQTDQDRREKGSETD